MSRQPTAIVVGAGISGLTAAYRLAQAGFAVEVLEAEASVGGRMSSVEVGGFVMNRGATILPGSFTHVRDLAIELGFGEQIGRFDGVLGVMRDGEVHRVRSDHMVLDGLRTKLLSWPSKLRLSRLAFDALRVRSKLSVENLGAAARFDTQTAIEYADRYLNEEIKRYAVEPVIRGISSDASIVEFWIAGMSTLGSGFMRYPGGISFLVEALADRCDVMTGAAVRSVVHSNEGVEVSWQRGGETCSARVDACVLAIPACRVGVIYPQLDPRVAQLFSTALRYGMSSVAHFGLSRVPAEPSMVVLLPGCEYPGLCAVMFDHHLRPSLARPSKGQVSGLFTHEWSEQRLELSDAELLREAASAMAAVVPELGDAIEVSRIDRWSAGALKGELGYCAAIAEVYDRLDASSPVQLAGDYFSSSSSEGCVVSAQRAAARLIQLRGLS